jgi:mRNA interferase HigB
VHILSRKALRDFWEGRKGAVAERYLSAWFRIAKREEWPNFASLKQTFGSADQVGNCVVFDVGNNRYRLIGRVEYVRGKIYILRVMDHAEYGKNRWPNQCGCYEPPPKKRR